MINQSQAKVSSNAIIIGFTILVMPLTQNNIGIIEEKSLLLNYLFHNNFLFYLFLFHYLGKAYKKCSGATGPSSPLWMLEDVSLLGDSPIVFRIPTAIASDNSGPGEVREGHSMLYQELSELIIVLS